MIPLYWISSNAFGEEETSLAKESVTRCDLSSYRIVDAFCASRCQNAIAEQRKQQNHTVNAFAGYCSRFKLQLVRVESDLFRCFVDLYVDFDGALKSKSTTKFEIVESDSVIDRLYPLRRWVNL